jgi:hypothetical protein
MLKLFVGLLALGSISAFANNSCSSCSCADFNADDGNRRLTQNEIRGVVCEAFSKATKKSLNEINDMTVISYVKDSSKLSLLNRVNQTLNSISAPRSSGVTVTYRYHLGLELTSEMIDQNSSIGALIRFTEKNQEIAYEKGIRNY